jgi:hypothetical protein
MMRTVYQRTEKTGACITCYLTFCILVYGLLGLGYYQMFQARHIANAGLAAYRAPIATIFGYDPTERFAYIGPMLTEDGEMFEETTVALNASKAAIQPEHN